MLWVGNVLRFGGLGGWLSEVEGLSLGLAEREREDKGGWSCFENFNF